MIQVIYKVINPDDFYDMKTGEAVPYLTYETPMPPDVLVSEGVSGASLEELVGLCDHGAENCNAHEFVGTHRLLGAVLFRSIGREHATEIMAEIAIRGGLDGMNGACGQDDSYAEFGVGEAGYDWDGKYE